jgi:magnesium chelatase family protein
LLAKTLSISLFGLLGRLIEVETDISSNLPAFVLVGLPDASVNEAAARVRAAATNSKLAIPARRITVNLSPASVPKQGSSYALAIAVSVLAAAGHFPRATLESTVYFGELGLDGAIKPVLGVLAAVVAAKRLGIPKIVVPLANLQEALVVKGIEVVGYDHLSQVASHLGASVPVVPMKPQRASAAIETKPIGCFSEVVGQEEAVFGLKLAAIGGHHLMMIGPPGAGKTMLASRLPGILPELDEEQAIDVGSIYSLSKQSQFQYSTLPPFQAPHHTATLASMVGGGSQQPRPGLISRAHLGVLFLDEAPEFQLAVLESLRQPLESGQITISRASGQATFPAQFQLVMAANPCPCGHATGSGKNCSCSAGSRSRYLSKLSGPLSDRIDVRLQLNPVNASLINRTSNLEGESSGQIREQVVLARANSSYRLAGTPWKLNSQVAGSYLRRELRLSASVTKHLDAALDQRLVSMRGYDRCLRLAWSIADLSGKTMPNSEDLALATFYRGVAL